MSIWQRRLIMKRKVIKWDFDIRYIKNEAEWNRFYSAWRSRWWSCISAQWPSGKSTVIGRTHHLMRRQRGAPPFIITMTFICLDVFTTRPRSQKQSKHQTSNTKGTRKLLSGYFYVVCGCHLSMNRVQIGIPLRKKDTKTSRLEVRTVIMS